jgi:ligand-binding sensor domain-containing protein
LSYSDEKEFIMDKAPPSGGGKPRRKSKEKPTGNIQLEPLESSNMVSVEGNISNSTVIAGNENTVNIHTSNERERKIASDILKINELLDKGQTRLAREKLAEIESLRVDFPGLESVAKRLPTVARRQGYTRLMYAVAAAIFLFLIGAYLVDRNRQVQCETGERYYLTGVLAITEQKVEGGIRLWVGAANEGLTVKDKNKKVENIHRKENLKSNSITVIAYDEKRNGMWIGTGGGGLAFIDSSLNVQRTFTPQDKIPGCKITDVVLTREGIYVTAIAGMGMGFSADGVKWETIPIPQDYQEKKQFDIFDAASDSDGSVWVGTYQDVYQRVGDNWKHYQPPEIQGKSATVQAIAVDDDSVKWVGTINGLFLLDTRSGTRWSRLFTVTDGLASNNVTSLAIVDKNNAFVGTTNGVSFCERDGGGLEIKCHTKEADRNLGRINTITVSLDGIHTYLGGITNDPTSRPIK